MKPHLPRPRGRRARPRSQARSGWLRFATWLALFGLLVGPVAHELLTDHGPGVERAERADLARHDHEHERAASDAVAETCPDGHRGHRCAAVATLRAVLLTLARGPGHPFELERRPEVDDADARPPIPVVLERAPKTSPPFA